MSDASEVDSRALLRSASTSIPQPSTRAIGVQIPTSLSTESHAALATRWRSAPSVVWTEIALQSIAKYRLNPLRAARLLAHLHAALHDAWLSCAEAADSLRCARVAQHAAAGRVLEHFLPAETPGRFGALSVSALASLDLNVGDRSAIERGDAVGASAIQRALEDGAARPLRAPPRPAPRPGTWRPTPPLFALNPVEAGAPRWRTWVLSSGGEIQPPPPPSYGSPAYVAEMREVLDVRQHLTDAQKQIADDWNLDVGTATPPGVWNRHAMRYVARFELPLGDTTRLMATMNLAMFDALVACWTAKLTWWTERPVLEIQERFDPQFLPYISTPPFPGYVSGHASTSGAASEVLAAHLPQIRSDVSAMADEAALSRLYGGIHVRSDNEAGLQLGRAIGRLAVQRMAQSAIK